MDFFIQVLLVGFMAAGAKLMFLAKIGAFRRVLAFDAFLDVVVGSVFGFLFYGTLMGMVIAAVATLTFSGFCFVWKQILGYERLTMSGYVPVPPRWNVRGRHVLATVMIAGLVALTSLR